MKKRKSRDRFLSRDSIQVVEILQRAAMTMGQYDCKDDEIQKKRKGQCMKL